MGIIKRTEGAKIVRHTTPKNIKGTDEVQEAYRQTGGLPRNGSKSWYRDIYDNYQNNEC